VKANIKIRPAWQTDVEAVVALRRESILAIKAGAFSRSELRQWAALTRATPMLQRIQDDCVLVAEHEGRLLASNGLDLDRQEMVALFVSPQGQGRGLGRKMVNAIERLAVRYGLLELRVCAVRSAIEFYTACGYQPNKGANIEPDTRSGMLSLKMQRRFPRRQTRFGCKIAALHRQLDIPDGYGPQHRLAMQSECPRPVSIGKDMFGRQQVMAPRAARAWLAMQDGGLSEGIELQAVSAFRSADYQAGIIKRKLAAGLSIEQILKVSAAPGYSQHHTGRALDISTPGYKPLEEGFDQSPAFKWLKESAGEYGFSMTFPSNNRHGVAYEPWHWCWRDS